MFDISYLHIKRIFIIRLSLNEMKDSSNPKVPSVNIVHCRSDSFTNCITMPSIWSMKRFVKIFLAAHS